MNSMDRRTFFATAGAAAAAAMRPKRAEPSAIFRNYTSQYAPSCRFHQAEEMMRYAVEKHKFVPTIAKGP